jgi:predicted transcriptional regulator
MIEPRQTAESPEGVHLLTHSIPGVAGVPWRVREIAMLRGLGYSFREIAGPLGVTPQAVSLMLSRHRRSVKSLRGAIELGSLSPRAVNALARLGIRSRAEARDRLVLDRLQNARNCGRKTVEEIRNWIDAGPGSSPLPGMSEP